MRQKFVHAKLETIALTKIIIMQNVLWLPYERLREWRMTTSGNVANSSPVAKQAATRNTDHTIN